jgi:hypothetical protein
MLLLDAWSMKIPVISTLRETFSKLASASRKAAARTAATPRADELEGGHQQRDKDTDEEKEKKSSAKRQHASAAASRQKAQAELLKRGILQMSALLAFTVLFLLLVRFRGQRLGAQQQ